MSLSHAQPLPPSKPLTIQDHEIKDIMRKLLTILSLVAFSSALSIPNDHESSTNRPAIVAREPCDVEFSCSYTLVAKNAPDSVDRGNDQYHIEVSGEHWPKGVMNNFFGEENMASVIGGKDCYLTSSRLLKDKQSPGQSTTKRDWTGQFLLRARGKSEPPPQITQVDERVASFLKKYHLTPTTSIACVPK